jgi:hypothetical protein
MARCHSTSAETATQAEFAIPSCDVLTDPARGPSPALLADLGEGEVCEALDIWACPGGGLDAGWAPSGGNRVVAAGARGHLTNRPPTNSKGSPIRSAVGGLDWLEWCSYGEWRERTFRELCERLDQAKKVAQASGGETVIELAGEPVIVKSSGVRRGLYCTWCLVVAGVEIGLVNEWRYMPRSFNVHVIARSEACMVMGMAVHVFVAKFLERLGYLQKRSVISRADLSVDLLGVTVEPFVSALTSGAVVRRARKSAVYFEGLRSTGFSVGGSAVMLRVYDKALEMRSSGDVSKASAMLERRWCGESNPDAATRVEFQLKRDALAAMDFHDVPKFLGNLREVARWLTEDWIRFTDGVKDRTHSSLVGPSALWVVVQRALFEAFRYGDDVPITWRHPLRALPEKLLRQAAGCVSSALAFLGSIPEAVDDVGRRMVSAMSDLFVGMVSETRRKRLLVEARGPIAAVAVEWEPPGDDFQQTLYSKLKTCFLTEHKKQ